MIQSPFTSARLARAAACAGALPAALVSSADRARVRRSGAARPIVLFVCIAVAGAFSAGWVASNMSVRAPREPSLISIPPEKLDFGEVWATSAFEMALPIHNSSAATVKIAGLSAGCNCVGIIPESMTIPPGGTETVHLTLNLLPRDEAEGKVSSFPFSVGLVADLRGSARTREKWTITGRVRRHPLHADPLFVDFGHISYDGRLPAARVVEVASDDRVDTLVAECEPLDSGVVAVERSAAAAQTFRVSIVPNVAAIDGNFHFRVRLSGTGAIPADSPPQTIRVRGTADPDIHPSPRHILSSTHSVGESFDEIISLESFSGGEFEVSEIRSDNNDVDVTRVESAPGGRTNVYRACFTCRRAGNQSATITFVASYREAGRLPVDVRVRAAYSVSEKQTGPNGDAE